MQRCCSPHDEGVLALSSTSLGRQLRKISSNMSFGLKSSLRLIRRIKWHWNPVLTQSKTNHFLQLWFNTEIDLWDPSITFERIKLHAANFVYLQVTQSFLTAHETFTPKEAWLWSRDSPWNFGAPFISSELLNVLTLNITCSLAIA